MFYFCSHLLLLFGVITGACAWLYSIVLCDKSKTATSMAHFGCYGDDVSSPYNWDMCWLYGIVLRDKSKAATSMAHLGCCSDDVGGRMAGICCCFMAVL